MKKLLIVLFSFLALIAAVIAIAPFVIQVDQYRPTIEKMVNEKIQGKLSLGKLALNLWGSVKVKVDGVKLESPKGKEMISVQEAYFVLPWMSLWTGEPRLEFVMKKPRVSATRSADGKIDLLGILSPPQAAAAPTAPSPAPVVTVTPMPHAAKPAPVPVPMPVAPAPVTIQTQPAAAPASGAQPLPAIATRARLTFVLEDAALTIMDAVTQSQTKVPSLTFKVTDFSLSKPFQVELVGKMDTRLGPASEPTLAVDGSFEMRSTVSLALQDGAVSQAQIEGVLDASALTIQASGSLTKPKGTKLAADWKIAYGPKGADVQAFHFQFDKAKLEATASLTPPPTSELKASVKMPAFSLEGWDAFVPALKGVGLVGRISLDADAQGPTTKLKYRAALFLDDVQATGPGMPAKVKTDVRVTVVPDAIEKLSIESKTPGGVLTVQGKIADFQKPRIDLSIQSEKLNLDEAMKVASLEPREQFALLSQAYAADPVKAAKAGASDFDKMLDPLRRNPYFLKTQAQISMKFGNLITRGIDIKNLLASLALKDGVINLKDLSLGIWSGKIQTHLAAELMPAQPRYKFGLKIEGLDMKQAMESQLALFKNTLYGKMNCSLDGNGSSFNSATATKNLKASGNFKIGNARFATVDIGKVLQEALNRYLEMGATKVAALKGKKIEKLPDTAAFYEFATADFKIDDGRLSMPNFYAKAMPNAGLDLKGRTEVGLIDDKLSAQWEILDPFNISHAADFSPDAAGVTVPRILAEPGAPVRVPVDAGCTTASPCVDYGKVPVHFGAVVSANIARAAGEKAKAEATKAVRKQVEQIAPPAIQDAIKKFW